MAYKRCVETTKEKLEAFKFELRTLPFFRHCCCLLLTMRPLHYVNQYTKNAKAFNAQLRSKCLRCILPSVERFDDLQTQIEFVVGSSVGHPIQWPLSVIFFTRANFLFAESTRVELEGHTQKTLDVVDRRRRRDTKSV